MDVGEINMDEILHAIKHLENREQVTSFIDLLYNPIITQEILMNVFDKYLEYNEEDSEKYTNDDLKQIIDHPLFDVNLQYYADNNTPLFQASAFSNYTIIEYLLQKGAYINYVNAKGINLLVYIFNIIYVLDEDQDEDDELVIKRYIQTCKELIKHGINVTYKTFVCNEEIKRIITSDNYFNLDIINKYDDELDYYIYNPEIHRLDMVQFGGSGKNSRRRRSKKNRK